MFSRPYSSSNYLKVKFGSYGFYRSFLLARTPTIYFLLAPISCFIPAINDIYYCLTTNWLTLSLFYLTYPQQWGKHQHFRNIFCIFHHEKPPFPQYPRTILMHIIDFRRELFWHRPTLQEWDSDFRDTFYFWCSRREWMIFLYWVRQGKQFFSCCDRIYSYKSIRVIYIRSYTISKMSKDLDYYHILCVPKNASKV